MLALVLAGTFASSFLSRFRLAAILCAMILTTFAFFFLAGRVGAHAVVLTLVGAGFLADSSLGGVLSGSLVGVVVVTSRHPKSESSGDGNGEEKLFHCFVCFMVLRPG